MTSAQTWELAYQPSDLLSPDGPDFLPPETAQSVHRVRLNLVLESPKLAREFTRDTLRDWQLDALVYEAVVIASELVTNAIRACLADGDADSSGISGIELAWQRHVSRLICVVTDRSAKPPVLVAADSCAESGRGLQVVQALAATWGWMRLGAQEKAVWATLLLPLESGLSLLWLAGRPHHQAYGGAKHEPDDVRSVSHRARAGGGVPD